MWNTAHHAYKERCDQQEGFACPDLRVQKDHYSTHLWILMIRSSRAKKLKSQAYLAAETSEK